ncbi:hypothetical protein GCM10011375_07300 [Hymenobacter qilianensis]|uniref:Uncharacterized protein n=2 Tax=Hymenobacter qilianensis TaxID=1385715 RepID=A0ACB5PMX6_9BACT|nr:DUF2326 domain-containing protein [Hymenobacter qilianensis]QNP53630.1 DUF2326 domain-containing protein [Hymenobacter qilianensis]GGF54453.1 hypothetical protein GCM10011375_07300 [Hymenobacter qilianensis]
MFLKNLKIENEAKVVREVLFHKGLNLIIDETPTDALQQSGNNVGKTTVLKLIDFCLGGDGKNIYNDSEFKEKSNVDVENFLKDNNIIITLILKDDLTKQDSAEIIIRRNFLKRSEKIQEINNESYNDKDFLEKLKSLVFHSSSDKPTFRQIIAKNIRYEKSRLDNTIKVLHITTKAEEYEALYLFWLGIDTNTANKKQKLQYQKSTEEAILKKLRKETSHSQIIQALSVINRDIQELNLLKDNFSVNDDYQEDLNRLNIIKAEINKLSTELARLALRRDIILEAKDEIEKEYANINTKQLEELYKAANAFIPKMQATFEEMLEFHNKMLQEKVKFISSEIPKLEQDIVNTNQLIQVNVNSERSISQKLIKLGAIEELENIIQSLNKKYEQKGRYEEQLRQWNESTEKLEEIEKSLININNGIASFEIDLEKSIIEFNKFFSKVSEKLYGEQFILSQNKTERAYELKIGSVGGLGTGKKKGQIAAFDIAYIQFCDENDIPCVHFILHDQIENIHDNQLTLIADVVSKSNIQFIVPVLRDKLPPDLNPEDYKILSLSQNNKLFGI